jgi:hypothetical protein
MSTYRPKISRELVSAIGIGQFNATMVIPFLLMAPATTDPKSPPIMMLVRHLQMQLTAMGWPGEQTGYLDMPTAAALERLVGPGWMNRTWSQVVGNVVSARKNHVSLAPIATQVITYTAPEATGAFDFLPDLPGGTMTYVALGGLAYYLYKNRKR